MAIRTGSGGGHHTVTQVLVVCHSEEQADEEPSSSLHLKKSLRSTAALHTCAALQVQVIVGVGSQSEKQTGFVLINRWSFG